MPSDLVSSLNSYSLTFPLESGLVEDFIEFLEAPHELPFHRTNQSRHITGSAWLISPGGDEVLLTQHRKLNRWLQLGGHCDGDSNILATAIREAEEESGIVGIKAVDSKIYDIDKHLIPARGDEPNHFHYDIRFLLRAPTKEFTTSSESHELKWFHFNDEFFKSSEAVDLLRMHSKWCRYIERL